MIYHSPREVSVTGGTPAMAAAYATRGPALDEVSLGRGRVSIP
jgi:hypothetical protein